eukprot:Rmarinus@m.18209
MASTELIEYLCDSITQWRSSQESVGATFTLLHETVQRQQNVMQRQQDMISSLEEKVRQLESTINHNSTSLNDKVQHLEAALSHNSIELESKLQELEMTLSELDSKQQGLEAMISTTQQQATQQVSFVGQETNKRVEEAEQKIFRLESASGRFDHDIMVARNVSRTTIELENRVATLERKMYGTKSGSDVSAMLDELRAEVSHRASKASVIAALKKKTRIK